MSKPFPFNTGASELERAHPHIVERLRLTWGFPEGGRYLAKLIVDTRGGRVGFSPSVMSELLTLATLAADYHVPERGAPFKGSARQPAHARHGNTLTAISFETPTMPLGHAGT